MAKSITSTFTRRVYALHGAWDFQLDPDGVGVESQWFTSDLASSIQVPGSWEEQGFGAPAHSSYLGGWTKKHNYTGAAWYQRRIAIDAIPENGCVTLRLAGVRWRSRVWIDEQYAGETNSLSATHEYDLTPYIEAGKSHRLTIEIDNTMQLPLDESHINSLQTATWWGGITGSAEIEVLPALALNHVLVRPEVETNRFDLRVVVDNHSLVTVSSSLRVQISSSEMEPDILAEHSIQVGPGGDTVDVMVNLGENALLWTDEDPFLYDITIQLISEDEVVDQLTLRSGLRTIQVESQRILLNGQPVFLRGYVDCCIFPNTGYPSWDKDEYLRQFRIAKAHGFNHVRLHSWHPPEPFWQAADEVGMLVQTELPNWTAHYGHHEQPAPEDVHAYLWAELERIIINTNPHPSWVLFSNGNELIYGADGHPQLNALIEHAREIDPTRLYTDNTGFGLLPAPHRSADYFIQSCNWHPPQHLYDAATANTYEDFRAVTSLTSLPVVGHEHGQFTMYVRPQEAEKYLGVIQPAWLESLQKSFEAKGMSNRVDDYITASGRHLVTAYKENIERARRTPGLAGIQLLDIRDFPGQGHATTGILDMFWDSKDLIAPEEFAAFNGTQVLLMRARSRTFTAGQPLTVTIEMSNFGARLESGSLMWSLRDRERIVASGEVSVATVPAGALTHLADLTVLSDVAGHLVLEAEMNGCSNAWSFWAFPEIMVTDVSGISSSIDSLRAIMPGADFSDNYAGTLLNIDRGQRQVFPNWSLAISHKLTYRLMQYLVDGGRVWLMPDADQLYDHVTTRFLPPFWSYLHFPDNVSSVMGTLIDNHPALGQFPHDGMSDWQWFDLYNGAPAICLDSVAHVPPIVEVIDNFNRAKRLAYAFEMRVGRGQMFVSTWRLYENEIIQRPESRFLFSEILRYLCSDEFQPQAELTTSELLGLLRLTNARPQGFED